MDEPPVFRRALRADLPTLVHLLADDPLGAQREADLDPLPDAYWRAFDAIDADPNNELVVAMHVSRENNTEAQARAMAQQAMGGHPARLYVAAQDEPTPLFRIENRARMELGQTA